MRKLLLVGLLLALPATAQLQPGETADCTYAVVNDTVSSVVIVEPTAATLVGTWACTVTAAPETAAPDWSSAMTAPEQGKVNACGFDGVACTCNQLVPQLYVQQGAYVGDANVYVTTGVGSPIADCDALPGGTSAFVEGFQRRIQEMNYSMAQDIGRAQCNPGLTEDQWAQRGSITDPHRLCTCTQIEGECESIVGDAIAELPG